MCNGLARSWGRACFLWALRRLHLGMGFDAAVRDEEENNYLG